MRSHGQGSPGILEKSRPARSCGYAIASRTSWPFLGEVSLITVLPPAWSMSLCAS
jgi:hypothetical protein